MARHPIKDIYNYIVVQFNMHSAFYPYTGSSDDNISATVPVYPVQQVPESNSNTGPYMVYDVTPLSVRGEEFWIHRDSAMFTVYSADYSQLTEWIMDLRSLFGRMDQTANDINATLIANSISTPNKFLCFYVVDAIPGTVAQDEAGRMGQPFVIEYEYTRSIDSNGKFAS